MPLVEKALASETPRAGFFQGFYKSWSPPGNEGTGEQIPSLPEAFGELERQGYRDVLLQPTHILYGTEYEKMMGHRQAVYRPV